MQFAPDYRNIGGRYLILKQLHNHRLTLRSIQERESNLQSPNVAKKRKRKIDEPDSFRRGCLTERQQIKPLFFRRQAPSDKKSYSHLLYKPPLSYPKANRFEKTEKYTNVTFNKSSSQQVSWSELVKELDSIGEKIYQTDLKKYFYKLALNYQIYSEQDYAILIRILLQIFPQLKQEIIVDIFADIIQELET